MATATVTALTRSAVSPFVDAALGSFPQVRDRAVKAAEILLNGQIQRVGEYDDGADHWRAFGSANRPYDLSIGHGHCSCPDRAPRDPKGRKLCKHMLAAMYAVKAGVHRAPQADSLFARLAGQAQEGIALYVESKYTGAMRQGQRDHWVAYRLDDGPTVELGQALDVGQGNHAFWSAVARAGWMRKGHHASHGGRHVWRMTPDPATAEATIEQADDLNTDDLWD